MKKLNIFITLLLIICFTNCKAYRQDNQLEKCELITLDFPNCFIENKSCRIQICAKKGYDKKWNLDDGYCEYRLKYKNSATLYLSTDIYSGSHLNYRNRYDIGLEMYSKNNTIIDTIRNEGMQHDGKYWLEYVLGDICIGYINVPLNERDKFNHMVNSLKKYYYQ